jgi:hypothetical protein
VVPPTPFRVPSSSWPIPVAKTWKLAFTTLHSNFTETQQEVQQLNANIATINQKMHSSIATSIIELKEEIKHDITT